MKLRYYQIAIRYKNKMHDFHGWGVAVNLCQLTYFKRKKLCVTLYYSVVKKIQNSTIN